MSYMECPYCLRKYVKEAAFKKHECDQMKRHKEARTSNGLVAWEDYSTWQSIKGRRNYGQDQFIESKVFRPFLRFVAFARKLAIPSKKKFMECMVELEIQPKDWSKNIVYEHFISQYEVLLTPEEQAAVTVETIFELTRIFECEAHEVFIYLEPSSLIRMVQAKKMSPWILMVSMKFLGFVKNEMTREQRIVLSKFMDFDKWDLIFEKHPKKVEKMKTYVKALKL